MTESHDEQTSDEIWIHAVEIPPLPTRSTPPAQPDLTPMAPEPEESSETDAVSPEPLDDAVDSPGGVTLAPQDDESHEDLSVKAIGGSMPIAKSMVRRLRSLILLLLAVVLSCVAIWTPKELQAVAARSDRADTGHRHRGGSQRAWAEPACGSTRGHFLAVRHRDVRRR